MNAEAQILYDLYKDCPLCGHPVRYHFRFPDIKTTPLHESVMPKPTHCCAPKSLNRGGQSVGMGVCDCRAAVADEPRRMTAGVFDEGPNGQAIRVNK